MGNTPQTPTPPPQPPSPPPLLTAAVVGDYSRYLASYASLSAANPLVLQTLDAQGNNILHAALSCANAEKWGEEGDVLKILRHVHRTVPPETLKEMYSHRSQMGCNPLWIAVAYGNVAAVKHAVEGVVGAGELLAVPNGQGDTCVIATCSKGNVSMLEYLQSSWPGCDSSSFSSFLSKPNSNGTTPIQIAVANSHLSTLHFLCSHSPPSSSTLRAKNSAGLTLFHIAAERNFHRGLEHLLSLPDLPLAEALALTDKNGAGCLHVAAFCGNVEAVSTVASLPSATVSLLDTQDGEGRTAYWLAMLKGCVEAGRVLRERGVVVEGVVMEREIRESEGRREEGRRKKEEAKALQEER